MMIRTESEKIFEIYCENSGIRLSRIPEEDAKTPDCVMSAAGIDVIAEVKEFQLNEEERESGRLLDEKGIGGVLTVKPGARVRKKINDSLKQIRARTEGKLPGMLVLYDQGRVAGHIDPYNIKTAMYGLEQVHFAVQRDPSKSPYAAGMSHEPGQKMTENDNTSISAIAALWMSDASNIHLHVYHNTYAVVPLEPTVLASFPVVQYLPTTCEVGNTRDWVKYEP